MRETNEMEISIIDMLWNIVGKWRIIVGVMVICAVAVGALDYKNSYDAYQIALQGQEEDRESFIEDYANVLDEDSLKKVEYTVEAVNKYELLYDQQEEYVNRSILMLENPLSVPTVTLQYYIDNHYRVEFPVIEDSNNLRAILQAYILGVENEELFQKIADELGEDLPVSYYDEVIAINNLESGFNVQITHYNKEECEKIAEIIKDHIESQYEELVAINGDFDITLVVDKYQEKANLNLLTTQQDNIARLANIKKAEAAMKDDLSEDEMIYYEYLLNEENDTLNSDSEDESLISDGNVSAPSISIKHIIMGAVLGIVLVVGCMGALYFLDKRLHRADDLPEVYGVDVLGVVEVNGRKKKRLFGFIDLWIQKLRYGGRRSFSAEESIKMAVASIRISLKETECKNLLITGCAWTDQVKTVVKEIQKELLQGGISVQCAENMIYNPEDIMLLQSVEGVVLVDTLQDTTFEEVGREVGVCRKGNVPVLGSIVIRRIN